MSRTTSIAGVRPLVGSRACALSAVAWRGRAQRSCSPRAQRGWRQSRHGAWERAMIMRVSALSQAEGRADGKPCTRQKLRTGRGSESAQAQSPRTLCQAVTVMTVFIFKAQESITSHVLQFSEKFTIVCMSQLLSAASVRTMQDLRARNHSSLARSRVHLQNFSIFLEVWIRATADD